METLNILLTDAERVTILVFLLLIFLSFVKYIFSGDNDSKLLQKVIGGLSILTVAILSKNPWVFSVSVLIGGLIIASEEFMMSIAALMKSRDDKIADTVSALKIGKATPNEIKEKIVEEEKEAENEHLVNTITNSPRFKTIETSPETGGESLNKYNKSTGLDRIKKAAKVEALVQHYLKTKFGDSYERHIKISLPDEIFSKFRFRLNSGLILDGVIKKDGEIDKIVEIKYISSLSSYARLRYIIIDLRHKLSSFFLNQELLIVIVSEKINIDIAKKSFLENHKLATLWFMKLTDKEEIEPILTPDIFLTEDTEKIVPTE